MTHQLTYVLPKLYVDTTIVKTQLEQLVSTPLVTGVQLLLAAVWITNWGTAQGALVVCNEGSQQHSQ